MCPTCGHTVQKVNDGINPKTWWCPRCGTLKTDGVPDFERPRVLNCVLHQLQYTNCGDRHALWAKVTEFFGVGSSTANEICKSLDYDPDHGSR